jgi:flavin reductase (DIM6/NTAB) family NADH-FMN oxidoreductase RutF
MSVYIENISHTAIKYLATKPLVFITTLHPSGIVNAGVFGAYTNLSPSQAGFAISRDSHTYRNILTRKEFVVNVPGADLVKAIAIIASDIPESKSEVTEAGLTLKSGITVKTPSIAECQSAVEFVFERDVEVGEHSFIIGRVTGGWIRKDVLDPDGRINIFKARVMKDFKYPEPLYVLPGEVISG